MKIDGWYLDPQKLTIWPVLNLKVEGAQASFAWPIQSPSGRVYTGPRALVSKDTVFETPRAAEKRLQELLGTR